MARVVFSHSPGAFRLPYHFKFGILPSIEGTNDAYFAEDPEVAWRYPKKLHTGTPEGGLGEKTGQRISEDHPEVCLRCMLEVKTRKEGRKDCFFSFLETTDSYPPYLAPSRNGDGRFMAEIYFGESRQPS